AHRQFDKYPEVEVAVLVPYDLVIAQAEEAEQRYRARVFRQMGVALGLVLLLAVAVVIAARVVSREFTLPIGKLAATAQKVAQGDLQARAEVTGGDELGDLASAFNDMLPKLQDRLRMRQSLSLAMEVQQNLLPGRPPRIPGLDIAGHSLYCDETGGDYYDFIEVEPLQGHAVLAAVGDVTGHGVAAALLMTTARALLRSRSALPGELAQVVTDINRQLSHDTPQGRFMTLYLLLVDRERQQLCWVSAGHDPAFCYDPAADRFEELSGQDIPLGIDESWEYRQESRACPAPGQVIVIGTDGIWEARNAAGEMYGKERLRQSIRRHADKPAEALSRALSDDVYAFLGDEQHQDDATQVVLKIIAAEP
ncbi:MAG: PP2C family protein-serine/threonine phosphatase, partial [Phycisphaerales bacterium JB038]